MINIKMSIVNIFLEASDEIHFILRWLKIMQRKMCLTILKVSSILIYNREKQDRRGKIPNKTCLVMLLRYILMCAIIPYNWLFLRIWKLCGLWCLHFRSSHSNLLTILYAFIISTKQDALTLRYTLSYSCKILTGFDFVLVANTLCSISLCFWKNLCNCWFYDVQKKSSYIIN